MMRTINLEDIVNEFELISDDGFSFLNRSTGELFHISTKDLQYAESEIDISQLKSEWLKEKIVTARELLNSKSYLKLPSKNEIDEFGLMLNFLRHNPNQNISKEILSLEKEHSVNNWRLINVILNHNIGREWYKYKREAFQKIAIDWCNKNSNCIPPSILQAIRTSNHI